MCYEKPSWASRFSRFTDVDLVAQCCLGTNMMYNKNQVLDNRRASSFPLFELPASRSCPHQVFQTSAEHNPPPSFCFPVSDNKLPENSSVFESAHGTRVSLSFTAGPLPNLALSFSGLAGATELAPYPRASVQKHRHCCSETRQAVMETAHFPDTWWWTKSITAWAWWRGGEKKKGKDGQPNLVPHCFFVLIWKTEHLVFQKRN